MSFSLLLSRFTSGKCYFVGLFFHFVSKWNTHKSSFLFGLVLCCVTSHFRPWWHGFVLDWGSRYFFFVFFIFLSAAASCFVVSDCFKRRRRRPVGYWHGDANTFCFSHSLCHSSIHSFRGVVLVVVGMCTTAAAAGKNGAVAHAQTNGRVWMERMMTHTRIRNNVSNANNKKGLFPWIWIKKEKEKKGERIWLKEPQNEMNEEFFFF